MARERFEAFSTRPEFPHTVARTRQGAEAELAAPCARFRLPYADEDRLRAKALHAMERLDPLRDSEFVAGTGTPLNWQRLLDFLHERKVIAAPYFEHQPSANDLPHVHNFRLFFDRSSRPTEGLATGNAGYGGALQREVAMSKAVGETLERYFLSTYSRRSFTKVTTEELSRSRKLDISELPGFLPFQTERFPELGMMENAPLYWVQGEEYASKKKTMLPAQCVFWNYAFDNERMLVRPTTSGCAGHFSKEEAVLAGLLENIQRDAFLIYWLNSLSPRVIDVRSFADSALHEYLEYLKRYEIEATFLNTTSDVSIPTVTCALVDKSSQGPVIALGSSTGFDASELLLHSAVEATLVHSYTLRLPVFELPERYAAFTQAGIGRPERLSLWRGKAMFDRFSFFLSGASQSVSDWIAPAAEIKGPEAQLAYTLERLLALGKGYETYVYEVHDPVLRELGYHVVRTIVPKLMPLYLFEHAAPLASERIKEVPQKIGYKPSEQFNPWPHPFP